MGQMSSETDNLSQREGRRRMPVMADVAKLAGVSHQTVSRVINGSAHVRPETRRRVMEAMGELDYRPNPAARALVTGRSGTLGVVGFDTTLYGPASTLFGSVDIQVLYHFLNSRGPNLACFADKPNQ